MPIGGSGLRPAMVEVEGKANALVLIWLAVWPIYAVDASLDAVERLEVVFFSEFPACLEANTCDVCLGHILLNGEGVFREA
jgi:hypothetical protein